MPDLRDSLDTLVSSLVRQARIDATLKNELVSHCQDILHR
jgi:hypothetical protein